MAAATDGLRKTPTGEAQWRRRFAAAARAGGLVLYESDRRSRSISWEGDTKQVLGYAPSEMGGYDWWYDRVHADDRTLVAAAMARGLSTAQAFAVEYRLGRADGSYYQVENGTAIDRLSRVDKGVDYGWDGTRDSMLKLAPDLGIPVVTANQALLWALLRAAGAGPTRVRGHGRLFRSG